MKESELLLSKIRGVSVRNVVRIKRNLLFPR